VAAGRGAVVARKLDEIDLVGNGDRAGEVGEEDEARFQQRDEQQVASRVVRGDLRAQLTDARANLLCAEEDLAYTWVRGYDARSSRKR
jgi:hypothetical protein